MSAIMRYTIWMLLFMLGACSPEVEQDVVSPQPEEDSSMVSFSVAMSQEKEEYYESGYFSAGDKIRICTPVSYSTPDFKDGAMIYDYVTASETPGTSEFSDNSGTSSDLYPYKFIPSEGSGFSWLTLQPTSIYYIFEAMYFPGDNESVGGGYFEEIPTRQDDPEEFKKADLLLAHHRVPISERGKKVQLTFHHAFAMVRVKVTIPETDNPMEGTFPTDALKWVYMGEMLTGYHVNYAEVISNDGLRTTKGVEGEDGRQSVYMYKVTNEDEDKVISRTEDGQIFTQHTYTYCGIVPAQDLIYALKGDNFLYFEVKKHDGKGEDDLTTYKFKPKAGLTLEASKILNLELKIEKGEQEAVILRAEILPWTEATANILAGKEEDKSTSTED